jgi:hypothetical protein
MNRSGASPYSSTTTASVSTRPRCGSTNGVSNVSRVRRAVSARPIADGPVSGLEVGRGQVRPNPWALSNRSVFVALAAADSTTPVALAARANEMFGAVGKTARRVRRSSSGRGMASTEGTWATSIAQLPKQHAGVGWLRTAWAARPRRTQTAAAKLAQGELSTLASNLNFGHLINLIKRLTRPCLGRTRRGVLTAKSPARTMQGVENI